MTTIENEHLNCIKMVSCKVKTIENQKVYRGHQGALGAPRGCRDYFGSVRGHQGCRGCQGSIGG